jgi:hypothetical protein
MEVHSLALAVELALAGIFLVSAVTNLIALEFVRRAYDEWGFPPKFYRVTGVVELLVAAFLAIPKTHIWGVALGAIVTFVAVSTLLKHQRYVCSLPGMVIMLFLIPVAAAPPL